MEEKQRKKKEREMKKIAREEEKKCKALEREAKKAEAERNKKNFMMKMIGCQKIDKVIDLLIHQASLHLILLLIPLSIPIVILLVKTPMMVGRSNDSSLNIVEDLYIIARWTPDWLMSLSLSQYENLIVTNKRNLINLFCKLNNKYYSK